VKASDVNDQWSVKSITWKVGPTVFAGAKFNASTAYTAVVVLDATSAYTFQGVEKDSYKHTATGAVVTNSANSGTATIAFPATAPATVKFMPNGQGAEWTGTGTYASWTGTASQTKTVNPGESITLPAATHIKRGTYTIIAWSLDSNGTSTNYGLGKQFVAPSSDTTLYAYWVDPILIDRDAAEKAIKAANDALANVAVVATIKIGNPTMNTAEADDIRNQIELLQTFLAGTLIERDMPNENGQIVKALVTNYDNASIERETERLIELTNAYKGGVILLASSTFQYTGGTQTAILATAGGTYEFELKGAGGGHLWTTSDAVAPGGKGGYVYAQKVIAAETNVTIRVGGVGLGNASINETTGVYKKDTAQFITLKAGGYNGGGNGGSGAARGSEAYAAGGSGGGASDIRIGGDGIANRVLVAGGGGGAGQGSGSGWKGGRGGNALPTNATAAQISAAAGVGYYNGNLYTDVRVAPQPGINANGIGFAGRNATSTGADGEGRGGGGGGYKGGGAVLENAYRWTGSEMTSNSGTTITASGAGGSNFIGTGYTEKVDTVIPGNEWNNGMVRITWIK
jgi:hypothetical protein